MNIFVDIDGTMTDNPESKWGFPNKDVIDSVKRAIKKKHVVVVWSANGAEYARRFCSLHKIHPKVCLAKPDVCVDDRPDIRPRDKMVVIPPEDFSKRFRKA
jgi:hypothetical protein